MDLEKIKKLQAQAAANKGGQSSCIRRRGVGSSSLSRVRAVPKDETAPGTALGWRSGDAAMPGTG